MENLNIDKEWELIKNEVFVNKSVQTPYPKWFVEARELLLKAQNILGLYQKEENTDKKGSLAEQYKSLIGEYFFRLNSMN